jgi:hypothetical protein
MTSNNPPIVISPHSTTSSTSSHLPTLPNVVVASINCNKAFLSNIDLYFELIEKYNISVLSLQEPGPLSHSGKHSTLRLDSHSPFSYRNNNFYSVSSINPQTQLSLLTLIHKDLYPFIKIHRNDSNSFQLIQFYPPYNFHLINVYINHNTIDVIRKKDLLQLECQRHKDLLIVGDLNSLSNPSLDYFSTSSIYQPKSVNLCKFLINSCNLTDVFRFHYPDTKAFTKWTLTYTDQLQRITATRIDYALASQIVNRKITSIKILPSELINSDHSPIILNFSTTLPPKIKRKPSRRILPHFTKWNLNNSSQLASFVNTHINHHLTSISDIDDISLTLSSHINSFLDSVSETHTEHICKKTPHPPYKRLKNLLLNTLQKLNLHATDPYKYPYPTSLLTDSVIALSTSPFQSDYLAITSSNSLISTIQTVKASINHITSKLQKKRNRKKKKDLRNKINKLTKDPTFDSRIIFKIIEPKSPKNEISYFVDHSLPIPTLVTDPIKVKSHVTSEKRKFFEQRSNPEDISEFLSNIPTTITEHHPPNFSTPNIISTLCNRANTCPGPDSIPFSFFKWCQINLPYIFQLISNIYSACYNLHYLPSLWLKGITTSIPKEEASQSLDNWRPITLLNTLYKGFTLILTEFLTNTLSKNNVLPPEQFGFIHSRSTIQALTIYSEILKYANYHKTPLHALYIDIKKAFDSVQHWTILQILNHLNAPPNFIKIIEFIFNSSTTQFITSHGLTDPVKFMRGVKQGDPISPILFILYMIPLQWSLKRINTFACPLLPLNHLCYADDLLLLSYSAQHMKLLFNTVKKYCDLTHLQIHPTKSSLSSIYSSENLSLDIDNTPIKKIPPNEPYKYLGIHIPLDLNIEPHFNSIVTSSSHNVTFYCTKRYLSTPLLIKLINTCIIPKITYTTQIFLPNNQTLNKLDHKITAALNRFINLPENAPGEYWSCHRHLKLPSTASYTAFIKAKTQHGLNSFIPFLPSAVITQASIPLLNLQSFASIIEKYNLTIKPNYNNFLPPTQILPETHEFWTDAHLNKESKTGSICFWNENSQLVKQATGHLSTTNFELQAINLILERTLNLRKIIIYSDSLSAIQCYENLRDGKLKFLSKSNFPDTLRKTLHLINLHKSNNNSISLNHVFSHLLDGKAKDPHRKITEMYKKYGDRYLHILNGNHQADTLCTSNPFPIASTPSNSPFLDRYFLCHNNIPLSNFNFSIHNIITLHSKLKWKSKHTLRSRISAFFDSIPQNIINYTPHDLQDFLQRSSQSYLPTKKRIYKSYKTKKPQYNSPLCNICNVTADHLHVLAHCEVARYIDNIAAPLLRKFYSKSKHESLSLWLPHPPSIYQSNSLQFRNLDLFWSARGLSPSNFLSSNSFSSSFKQKVWNFHILIAKTKWLLHCLITHSDITSITTLLTNNRTTRLIKNMNSCLF